MKNKVDKKVNQKVKRINKELKQDVFGDRFWVKQVRKATFDNRNYYLYELKDREQPERDSLIRGWLWGESFLFNADILQEVSEFIARSNFWSIYHNRPEEYDEEFDFYLRRNV